MTGANKPNQVIGLLLIKKLLRYDPSTKQTVSQLPLSLLPEARPDINCFQALDYFQTGRSHLLILTKNPGKPSDNFPAGVITLEGKPVTFVIRRICTDMHHCSLVFLVSGCVDVIEEIIGEEIIDETDRYESNMSKRIADRKSNAVIMKGYVLCLPLRSKLIEYWPTVFLNEHGDKGLSKRSTPRRLMSTTKPFYFRRARR